jgi:Leucine-rich repeat (LRR) protein
LTECSCVHLQELHLQGNELLSISGIQAPKRLRYLDLSSNNLTKMENLNFALHLTVLDLSYNHIVEIQVSVIKSIDSLGIRITTKTRRITFKL